MGFIKRSIARAKSFIELIRVRQWYKNLLVFVALVFSFNLLNSVFYPSFLQAFLLLCLVSSASYIINDVKDIEKDRQHPEKRSRPLPSGRVRIIVAIPLAVLLLTASLYLGMKTNMELSLILLVLFLTNQLYTFFLKDIVIVDAMALATDYVWRALAGITLIKNAPHPPVSAWFIFGIFFTAFLLATGKRRSELLLLGKDAAKHRLVFRSYNVQSLNYQISITSSLIILFYTLYTMNAPIGDLRLTITIPIVVYAVYRYVYLLISNSHAIGKPEQLFRDIPLLFALIAWVLSIVILLYFYPFWWG